jgi:hypothetical protein
MISIKRLSRRLRGQGLKKRHLTRITGKTDYIQINEHLNGSQKSVSYDKKTLDVY